MQNLKLNQYLKVKNNHSPLLFNSVLWFLIYIILLFVFTKGTRPIKVDFVYTALFLLFLMLPVLANFYILIPKFLKTERYLAFTPLFIANWLFFSLLTVMWLNPVLNLFFSNLFFISYPTGINIFIISLVVLVATTLIKLAEDWFYFNTNENELLKLKNRQVETQLSTLKAQINPHFLFNSLNVIYALALEKNEKISNSIIQLSDILRYVLYDTNVDRISISKEIELLKNYIEFQKVRQHDQHKVELSIDLKNLDYQIYPMLLLPLVENAYKHGDLDNLQNPGYIAISIHQNNKQFKFEITNSYSDHKNHNMSESSGIGLENIKSNLQLIYPGLHEFIIQETKDTFTVKMIIASTL
ncbi:sensor histidine kinase [Winogradskyella aurantiaca]|uniref:sensor histidine kinase n=1 Tax=Winogradskyella aurantiaca TaxID=2219558 RepID=UPI000E1DDFB6|nr:histidine kinase [Winogradskyella aurantiaca]